MRLLSSNSFRSLKSPASLFSVVLLQYLIKDLSTSILRVRMWKIGVLAQSKMTIWNSSVILCRPLYSSSSLKSSSPACMPRVFLAGGGLLPSAIRIGFRSSYFLTSLLFSVVEYIEMSWILKGEGNLGFSALKLDFIRFSSAQSLQMCLLFFDVPL